MLSHVPDLLGTLYMDKKSGPFSALLMLFC